jgi:hypothetical protein
VIAHPCARCGALSEGLVVGHLCAACSDASARRSGRLARRIALFSTVALAAYVGVRLLPGVPRPLEGSARGIAGAAIVAWWWLTYRIAKEVALVCLR